MRRTAAVGLVSSFIFLLYILIHNAAGNSDMQIATLSELASSPDDLVDMTGLCKISSTAIKRHVELHAVRRQCFV